MALDVIITPASGLVDFQNSGISSATIQLDGSGNLNIASSGGDIQIGDTSSDVYIGDGVNNVDIVFEQSGEIRGLTGKTITLGQSDSFVAFAGDVTGDVTFTGKLVFPDNGTVPENPTNEQYDYMTFGAHGSISQVSGRGALMIASSDDALILANGDIGRTFTSSNINVDIEDIFLLSDSAVRVKTDLQSGFGSENDYTFSGGVITSPRFTSTQATGTAPFTVSSTTVVTNLNADLLDGQQGSYYLNTSTSFGGDVSGTYNAIVVTDDSHNHSFDNLTGKTSGTGDYSTSGDIVSGRGSGGVALTINDGHGNANVTFNHQNGTPEQNGQAGRIEVNTDNIGGNATMSFELGSATANTEAGITQILELSVGGSIWTNNAGLTFSNRPAFNGGASGSTAPFTVSSTTVVTNLNADLLDGQQGSHYTNASNLSSGTLAIARGGTNSSATPTNGGVAYGTGSAYAFTSAGTSGKILTSNGAAAPTWEDAPGGFSVTNDTSTNSTYYPVFVDTTSGDPTQTSVSSTKLNFNPSTGNFSATQFTSLSDRTKKTNIRPIENALEITKQLEGVRFDWIDNDKPSVGLIAQEVEEILPELVETSDDGTKSVSYGNIIGVLIEAIKEQQKMIDKLMEK